MVRWRKRVWVNWTSSRSPLSNTKVSSPCKQISWQQIRITNPWFERYGWNESFPSHFNINTESVVSPTFQMKLVPLEIYYGARHREQWGWYAFECKARQAAQVMQNRLSHYGEVPLCFNTWALQGRIGHGNETDENSGARLCSKLKSHQFRTHAHMHADTPLPLKTLST